MKRVFCFGDSNTYGYDARSRFGERLPGTERWTDILQELSGWEILNEGMNGRVIPQTEWFLKRFEERLAECGPVDLVFIMLGSNDLLGAYWPDAEKVGKSMEQFVKHVLKQPAVQGKGEKILLAAPVSTDIGRFGEENECYDRESAKLSACYRAIAGRYGLQFADAASWEIPLAHDGVHITPDGHKKFAECLWKCMTESGEIRL